MVSDEREVDIALLRRIRDGDEAALAALYARWGRPLYSFAYRIVQDGSAAEDVIQDVFVAVWRTADGFDPTRGSPASWLFGLTRHKSIDLIRRESTRSARTVELVDLDTSTDDEALEEAAWIGVRRDHARRALDALGPDQRQAIELAFFAGLSHREVADRLDIPLGTAKGRIRTGLLRMRDVIGDRLSEVER